MLQSHFGRALLGVGLAAVAGFAQTPSTGPDVVVGGLTGPSSYTPSGGVSAFAIGTDSCNVGDAPLRWFDYDNPNVPASSNEHPVIAQNVYRLANGRFEQIGMSWLKHGYTALADNLCLGCNPPAAPPGGSSGDYLGVGCSDPYSSGLNGTQAQLGPRYQVNPYTGAYPHPFDGSAPVVGNARRILIANSDLGVPGALFFGEGQYVSPDDAAAGNQMNNASWRQMTFAPNGAGTGYNASLTGQTIREEPAVFAWKANDPLVSLRSVDVPGDGRFWVGYRATALGGGGYRHTYAVHNLNCDRALQSFAVALPSGVSATNLYFHDVNHHSGEPFVGTDWTGAASSTSVSWSSETHATNPNANALRWGTLFNFEFEAAAPFLGDATFTLFKPGSPASLPVQLCASAGLPSAANVSYATSSVAYDFVNISSIDAPGPSGNSGSVAVALPFPFLLYGETLNSVRISVEGYLCAAPQYGSNATNPALGSNASPNFVIAPYWDNLSQGAGASVTYATTGAAPNRRFVVHWNSLVRSGTSQVENFQALLDETTNAITFTYVASGNGGASATRGVEDGSGFGFTQLSFNAAGSVVAGSSVRLTRTIGIPQSAGLSVSGDGSIANPYFWRYVGAPNGEIILGVDAIPGPTDLGPYGVLNLGVFGPSFLALADGLGAFVAADPTAVTDACGVWTYALAIGPDPLPFLGLYTQAVGLNLNAPNGAFDISLLQQF